METNAKKLLDKIAHLLDKAAEEEGIKFMLIASHKNSSAVFFEGSPYSLGMKLAQQALQRKETALTVKVAHVTYIELMEKELAELKAKEAKECQEKSN